MSLSQIQSLLQQLAAESDDLLVCMVVSEDGLVIAHEGKVNEPDAFGAWFYELKLVCDKIITELDCEDVTEIYIRSKTGAVTLLPIFDAGYLACLSTVNINAGKVQMLAWKYARKLYELI